MNLFYQVQTLVLEKIKDNLNILDLINKDLENFNFPINITFEPPRNAKHGDITTNIAMILAKDSTLSPKDLAKKIILLIQENEIFDKIEIANPGFINLKINKKFLQSIIGEIIKKDIKYGYSNIGKNQKINLEYVSANPTGPLHIGHARGAVFGESLANLLQKTGYNITREYYVNDAGNQIKILAESLYLRYKQLFSQEKITFPENFYPGKYLIDIAKKIRNLHQDKFFNQTEKEWLPFFQKIAESEIIQLIKADLAKINMKHDVFFSEKSLFKNRIIDQTLELLQNKGLIYTGILAPPKGKMIDDWEPREQVLFKSTQFGDDVDRALKKSDGSWTYFASDIAYHKDKLDRNFKKMILILGADHTGYIKRLKASVAALSDNQAKLDIKICQLVNFIKDGKSLKMSKRAGNYITVDDVYKEVGSDVLRFIMLTRRNDVALDFDLDLVKLQSKDNAIFYIQYAHARCHSILKKAEQAGIDLSKIDAENINSQILENLSTEDDLNIIKLLANYPRIIELSSYHLEPHRIAFFLQDLASNFHSFWNKGIANPNLKFIIMENQDLTYARLTLVKAISIVIKSALEIFGIKAVKRM